MWERTASVLRWELPLSPNNHAWLLLKAVKEAKMTRSSFPRSCCFFFYFDKSCQEKKNVLSRCVYEWVGTICLPGVHEHLTKSIVKGFCIQFQGVFVPFQLADHYGCYLAWISSFRLSMHSKKSLQSIFNVLLCLFCNSLIQIEAKWSRWPHHFCLPKHRGPLEENEFDSWCIILCDCGLSYSGLVKISIIASLSFSNMHKHTPCIYYLLFCSISHLKKNQSLSLQFCYKHNQSNNGKMHMALRTKL